VSSKAIDINEWLKAPDDFLNKKRKDKHYLSVNGFLTEKEKTMKKKSKNNQQSSLGLEIPMSHMASQRFAHCANCTSVTRKPKY